MSNIDFSLFIPKKQDKLAESKVIATVLTGIKPFSDISALTDKDFEDEQSRRLFDIMRNLSKAGQEINLASVEDIALQNEDLYHFTAFEIEQFSKNAVTTDRLFNTYLKRVKQNTFDRDITKTLIAGLQGLQEHHATEQLPDLLGALSNLSDRAYNLSNVQESTQDFLTIANECYQLSKDTYDGKIKPALTTGFVELDKYIKGFYSGTLNILAARSGAGKTTLALNIIRKILERGIDKPILFFSMEMSSVSLAYSMISSLVCIPADDLKKTTGWYGNQKYNHFMSQSANKIVDDEIYPRFYVNQNYTSLQDVTSEIRRQYKRCEGLSLIVIDHLQLMHITGTKENRNLELGEVTRTIRELAKEIQCPVVLLSQLNRDIERGNPRTPRNSDLRDSGSIEADADTIIFLTRQLENPTEAKFFVTKNRSGETGSFVMRFDGQWATFSDMEQPQAQPQAQYGNYTYTEGV